MYVCIVLVVLGFELRASQLLGRYHLSHSASPVFVLGIFEIGSLEHLCRLASNHDPPDLCLLSS
jgi:hypothetical protein